MGDHQIAQLRSSYDPARIAFEESRRKLGVDVVDMYLIHWPFPAVDLYKETWKALLKLQEEGAITWLASSNFLPEPSSGCYR